LKKLFKSPKKKLKKILKMPKSNLLLNPNNHPMMMKIKEPALKTTPLKKNLLMKNLLLTLKMLSKF